MIALLTALSLLSAPSFAIENVRVEVGDGTVLDNATVVVTNGKIKSVGSEKIPKGVDVIDGTGKVLTPGLLETTSQLGLTEVSMVGDTNDYRWENAPFTPGFRVADGFNPHTTRIPVTREEGVTHAIINPAGGIISGTGALIDMSGTLRSRKVGQRAIAMFGSITAGSNRSVGGTRGGLWLNMRQLIDDTRYFQKNKKKIMETRNLPLLVSPQHLEAMVPVIQGKIPLVLDAHRASDILSAIEFAKTNKIRLVISGGAEAWIVADDLAKAQVPVIIRPTDQQPWSFDRLGARDDSATLLAKAGVDIIITAADWDQNARRLRQEAGIAVAFGLPHPEAIRAITSTPARIFGLQAHLGTVSKGRSANLVLWSADPLELRSVAEMVWIDGQVQSLDNRQEALAKRYLRGP